MAEKTGSKRRLYGYQPKPSGPKMENRDRSRNEYHTKQWTKLSASFRKDHPLCENCKKKGIVTPSEVTDHIIPAEIHGNFFDRNNLQALCKRCNNEKGNKDKRIINEHRKTHKSAN